MVNLLTLLLLCFLGQAYFPLYGCFYNQRIKIANDTYFEYDIAGYDFDITWSQQQGNITSFAYTLIGYRSELGNDFISFNGSLINVTSTDAVFVFEPQNGSSITYAMFSIILVQTCSGYIELQLIQYEPISLSLPIANRTSVSTQYCRANLSKPIANDNFNYQVSTFLSAFYLTEIGSAMDLSISSGAVSRGLSYNNIKIISRPAYANVYERIWFTFIIIHMPSFAEQVSTFTLRSNYASTTGLTSNVDNFYINRVFNQGYLDQQCVFSLVAIFTSATNLTQQINFINYSNTTIANITQLRLTKTRQVNYQAFCMQQCNAGFFVVYWIPQRCGKCWDFSYACEVCSYVNYTGSFICQKCFANNYLLPVRNRCYGNCPAGYFNNMNTQKCSDCNAVCRTCTDSQNCTSCIVGWPIPGGCTTIEGCIAAISPQSCVKCNIQGLFQIVGKTCICLPGYFVVTHLCTNVVGCVGTAISQNKTVCLLCDSMKGYALVNGLCLCKEGLVFNGNMCIEVCGDGKIVLDKCDDGNTVSGDGCSSTCQVEKNYRCSGGSLSPSKCIYQRLDIALSVSKITKNDYLNQGIFVIQITPVLNAFSLLNFSKLFTFSCNQTTSISQVSYSSGKITIIVDFFEDLQGNPAKVFLILDRRYFLQANASISFNMISNGAKLILTGDIGLIKLCKMLLTGVSVLAIVVFAASTFVHKMIGVELVFPLQIVYLVHLVNSNYSQPFGLLKYIGFASWNLMSIDQSTANIDSAQQNLVFSSSSQQFTLLVVAGLLVAAMFAFAITMTVKTAAGQEQSSQMSLSTFQRVLLCLYKSLLFPCTIAFMSTFFLMSSTHSLHERYTFPLLVESLFPLFMVLASLVFFYEWRVLLVAKETRSPFQGLPLCSKKHIPFFLTFVLLSALLFSYSYQRQFSNIALFAVGIELLLLVWMIVGRPYESAFHNVGVLVNLLPTVIFLTFDVLRDYQPALQTEKNEMCLVFALIGSAFVSSLTSISRIAFEVYLLKKVEEGRMHKKAQRKEAKLKRKQQLLDKIQRMKGECENSKKPSKQIDIAYLQKFRKENEYFSPHKLKGEALSSISVTNQKSRKDELNIKKKLRDKFGEKGFHYSKRRNLDSEI